MKLKLIKLNCKNVGAYGIENISTGDTIELSGHSAEKARNNPDFTEVLTKAKKNGNRSGNKKQSKL